mgnify:CR=1 FL=1
MLIITLTKETIDYQKLLAHLEKQLVWDDYKISNVIYTIWNETLIETITYLDNSSIANAYDYLEFDDQGNSYNLVTQLSFNDLLSEQIVNMEPYMYMLYDDVYDEDEENVILNGVATTLENAKNLPHGCIFATLPNKSTELTIYTEEIIDADPWYDDDPYYG